MKQLEKLAEQVVALEKTKAEEEREARIWQESDRVFFFLAVVKGITFALIQKESKGSQVLKGALERLLPLWSDEADKRTWETPFLVEARKIAEENGVETAFRVYLVGSLEEDALLPEGPEGEMIPPEFFLEHKGLDYVDIAEKYELSLGDLARHARLHVKESGDED